MPSTRRFITCMGRGRSVGCFCVFGLGEGFGVGVRGRVVSILPLGALLLGCFWVVFGEEWADKRGIWRIYPAGPGLDWIWGECETERRIGRYIVYGVYSLVNFV